MMPGMKMPPAEAEKPAQDPTAAALEKILAAVDRIERQLRTGQVEDEGEAEMGEAE